MTTDGTFDTLTVNGKTTLKGKTFIQDELHVEHLDLPNTEILLAPHSDICTIQATKFVPPIPTGGIHPGSGGGGLNPGGGIHPGSGGNTPGSEGEIQPADGGKVLPFPLSLQLSGGKVGIGTAILTRAKLETAGMVGNTLALFGQDVQGISLVGSYPSVGFNAYFNSGWKAISSGFTGSIDVKPDDGRLTLHTGQKAATADASTTHSARVTVLNDGRVGIGTTTPRNPLAIRGQGRGEELISFEDPQGKTKWHINQNFAGQNPGLNFVETGVADGRLFIKVGGNVGIGTINPQEKLHFEGTILVTKDVVLQGEDCAEDFDVLFTEAVEPGTVMVIDQDGQLRINTEAYDKKVAGVVSGAGKFKPGMVLGRQSEQRNRMPIALMGKVYCKVDAQYAPIEIGDLLTSSSTPGHAMKVSDPLKAFGAVIGKALKPLKSGTGLIPIIVALQ